MELESRGAKGLAVRCDVTDEASVADAVQKVVRGLGGLDVAVANAGFSVAGRSRSFQLRIGDGSSTST